MPRATRGSEARSAPTTARKYAPEGDRTAGSSRSLWRRAKVGRDTQGVSPQAGACRAFGRRRSENGGGRLSRTCPHLNRRRDVAPRCTYQGSTVGRATATRRSPSKPRSPKPRTNGPMDSSKASPFPLDVARSGPDAPEPPPQRWSRSTHRSPLAITIPPPVARLRVPPIARAPRPDDTRQDDTRQEDADRSREFERAEAGTNERDGHAREPPPEGSQSM